MDSAISHSKGISIKDLINMSRKELDELFLSSATPTLEEMNGVLNGSVLAGVGILNNSLLRKFINLGWLMWRGKIFESVDANRSKGINRFKIGPFKFLRYRCDTSINSPLEGQNDVYYLNYDISGNPWYIRRVRDDIKKVADGVYFGSANFKIKGKYKFVLYFGLESTKGNSQ